ncbi:MAG: VOC family protein [Antricoccus sp.]
MTEIQSPVPTPGPGAAAPPIIRAIYGMPMFATIVVTDLQTTTSWYVDGLGFINLFTMSGPTGPLLVHLRRWQFQDLLVRPGPGSLHAGNGSSLSFAAVDGELDELAARARTHGGGLVDGPTNTQWNTRDLTTTDPDETPSFSPRGEYQKMLIARSTLECVNGTPNKMTDRCDLSACLPQT